MSRLEIAFRTISALGKIVTGDGGISPYRSGTDLVNFFNDHGGNSLYGKGFPSRWSFAEEEIKSVNRTAFIKDIIEDAVDPRHYMENDFSAEKVVEHLNSYLVYDKLELKKEGLFYKIYQLNHSPNLNADFIHGLSKSHASHQFILEQNEKCRSKIDNGDYDGAITNARTMAEAVLEEVLIQSGCELPDHKGDLVKLFKAVRKVLNIEISSNMSESIKQTLSGLSSIVSGMAGLSNKMGDRHIRRFNPSKHHAQLVLNTSYALCEFVIGSLKHQKLVSSKSQL